MSPKTRLGDEERRLMHLVPAPAVRLMKRRVLSRPGVNSLMVLIFHTPGLKVLTLVSFLLSLLSLHQPHARVRGERRNGG